ncbi:hypothetical protein [Streptomyces wuyuanensis]|uniref:hypothetical protein n=1 Tax=Streptomyces wuyuanensis TaxID=1196353 RepID=UPI00342C529A
MNSERQRARFIARALLTDEDYEAAVGLDLLADEDNPLDVFGDTAYSAGDARETLDEAGHRFLNPAPLRPAVPAASPSTTSPSTPQPPS